MAATSGLSCLPSFLHTVPNIIGVMNALSFSKVCIGNPDDIFQPLIEARKGIFKNAQGNGYIFLENRNFKFVTIGTERTAEVESLISKCPTIRHLECDLVTQGERCSKCEKHRKSLLVMLHREQDTTKTKTDPLSHANYRYLSQQEASERCANLHKKLINSQKKISLLKDKIKKMCDENAVPVSRDLNEDLNSIMKKNFSAISSQYPENSFKRMFWEQHASAASHKDARGYRWHPAMIKWCLYLRHLSGKAYEMLRRSGVIVLPSQRTLRDYTHYIPSTIGYSYEVDQMLYDTMKV